MHCSSPRHSAGPPLFSVPILRKDATAPALPGLGTVCAGWRVIDDLRGGQRRTTEDRGDANKGRADMATKRDSRSNEGGY
jgi:hypothetical protein